MPLLLDTWKCGESMLGTNGLSLGQSVQTESHIFQWEKKRPGDKMTSAIAQQ